jgi:hypothetical protein
LRSAQCPGQELRFSTPAVFATPGNKRDMDHCLHAQSDGMVERYVKTVEKHLRMVFSTHQRYWSEWLPIVLLVYTASTHEARHLPKLSSGEIYVCPATCCSRLLPTKSSLRATTWWISWIGCMTSNFTPVNIWMWPVTRWRPVTTGWLIPRGSNKETNLAVPSDPDHRKVTSAAAILGRPTRSYHPVNDVACRIQRHPMAKMKVVNLDRLAPYLRATRDEQP